MDVTIVSTLLGVIVGFCLQELKEFINNRRKSKNNKINAQKLAKLYVLDEIIKNYELYSKKRGSLSVKDRIENRKDLHFIINGIQDGYVTESWDNSKIEIIKLDLELAEKIYKLYQRYYMLKNHTGRLDDLDIAKFNPNTFEKEFLEVKNLIR